MRMLQRLIIRRATCALGLLFCGACAESPTPTTLGPTLLNEELGKRNLEMSWELVQHDDSTSPLSSPGLIVLAKGDAETKLAHEGIGLCLTATPMEQLSKAYVWKGRESTQMPLDATQRKKIVKILDETHSMLSTFPKKRQKIVASHGPPVRPFYCLVSSRLGDERAESYRRLRVYRGLPEVEHEVKTAPERAKTEFYALRNSVALSRAYALLLDLLGKAPEASVAPALPADIVGGLGAAGLMDPSTHELAKTGMNCLLQHQEAEARHVKEDQPSPPAEQEP